MLYAKDSASKLSWFWRRCLSVFLYHIWACRPSYHADRDHLYKITIPFDKRLHMKFEEILPRGFKGEGVDGRIDADGRAANG